MFTVIIAGCRTQNIISQPQPTIEKLYDEMQELFADFSWHPAEMYAIFFEANKDGIPRALVTFPPNMHKTGELWYEYIFTNGKWNYASSRATKESDEKYGKNPDGTDFDPYESIECDMESFAIYTEENKEPKFIFFKLFGDWKKYDVGIVVYSRRAFEITTDSEGYLKMVPMSEFGFDGYVHDRYFAENNELYPEIVLKSPNDKLEPVTIHVYRNEKIIKPVNK